MGIDFKRRNKFEVYVRERYKSIIPEFDKLIKKDKNVLQSMDKNSKSLRSVAIVQLIYRYVLQQNPNFRFPNQNETSDKDNNKETETD